MRHNFAVKRMTTALLVLLTVLPAVAARAQWTIGDTVRDIDTLERHTVVAPGVSYYKVNLPSMPLQVSVLQVDLSNPAVTVETCLGDNRAVGRETPLSMARRNSYASHEVVAAVNGDFYMTKPKAEVGMPRSGQITHNRIVVSPTGRASLIIGNDGKPRIDRVTFMGRIASSTAAWRLHAVNMLRLEKEPTGGNQTFLFTSDYGPETYSCPAGGYKVLLRPAQVTLNWRAGGTDWCVVDSIWPAAGTSVIPSGQAILWLQGSDTLHAQTLAKGDTLSISLQAVPQSAAQQPELMAQMGGIRELVGGSDHVILKDGKFVDPWPQRHPRTCAGFGPDGSVLTLVVIDGRSKASRGVTLREAADVLQELGVTEAVNLDGGGSSCLEVQGRVINTPSDGHVRPVGNGLLVISRQ